MHLPWPGQCEHRHGALGSEAAIETADVVLMNVIRKRWEAIETARFTNLIWQNIVLAFAVKLIVLA